MYCNWTGFRPASQTATHDDGLCCGDRRCACLRGCVHLVLVRAAGQFRALDGTCQPSASNLLEVHVLHVFAQHVLRGRPARHAAKDHAVQQGIAAQAVVAVDAARHLAGGVESRDCLVVGTDARGVLVDQQAAHAVVDHRRDDGHVEGLLLHGRAGDDVVEELLPAARLAAGLPGVPT